MIFNVSLIQKEKTENTKYKGKVAGINVHHR
jgi:hypothetical protein